MFPDRNQLIVNMRILTKTRNEPERPKTSQNEPKRPPKLAKQSETTQNFKFGKVWKFLLVPFFKLRVQMLIFEYFGPRSINFLIF